MKFEWFVASRYLLSRRKQSFISIISIISIIGVSLGVATVILVIAVLDGVEHGLRDRFLANEAHIVLRDFGSAYFSDYDRKIEEIKKVNGVVAASPVVYSQSAIFRQDNNNIDAVILVKGIDPELEENVTGFSQFVKGSTGFQDTGIIEEASFINDVKITGGIVLGSRLAFRIGVNEGDVLRLVVRMVEDALNPDSLYPIIKHFVVIGLYESELAVYDNQIAFIHIETAQEIYEKPGQANVILVRLEDAERAPEIAQKMTEPPAFDKIQMPMTTTWLETHAPLFAALELEKIATVIIEALIILVAAFNIASTLIMTVMEKTRDIGTLRTLGSSRGNIMRIFMIQGSVIGLLGTFIGTALGLGLCWLLSTNIVRPTPWLALGLVVFLILIQITIAIRRLLPYAKIRRIGFTILWVIVIAFGLYCLVEPISLQELGLSQIYQMNQLPIRVNWFFVGFINVLSFAICWLATIYPAWQAANLNPIEALQYE